jgi:hypothetical protein
MKIINSSQVYSLTSSLCIIYKIISVSGVEIKLKKKVGYYIHISNIEHKSLNYYRMIHLSSICPSIMNLFKFYMLEFLVYLRTIIFII